MKKFVSFVNILPKLMIFCEYLSILRPHNLKNRKTGYPGFDSEKPDPFKWEQPGFQTQVGYLHAITRAIEIFSSWN